MTPVELQQYIKENIEPLGIKWKADIKEDQETGYEFSIQFGSKHIDGAGSYLPISSVKVWVRETLAEFMDIDDNTDNAYQLHVYGQTTWHEPVEIRGTRKGLLMLKSAIEQALKTSNSDTGLYYDSEGEGYDIIVRVQTEEEFSKTRSPASIMMALCSHNSLPPITVYRL